MRVAQQLYEGVDIGGETVGLISYMRTDGVQMAKEAIAAIRDHVGQAYGLDYLPGAPREYSSKAKNAQEAHEAIRPTDVARTPNEVAPLPERRAAPGIRPDLEARRRQPDAIGRAGPGGGGRGQRRHPSARQRLDRGVRRVPEAVPRSDRRGAGRRQPRRDPHAAADERARPAAPGPRGGRTALHPAAAALFRGQPGQAHGGAGDRPPLHLRLHPGDAAQPQLRPHGEPPAVPGGPRAAGHGLPDLVLRALRGHRVHRRAGGAAGRRVGRAARLALGDGAVLARVLPRHRPDARTEDLGRDRRAGPGSGRALLPRPGGRHRPAAVPGVP